MYTKKEYIEKFNRGVYTVVATKALSNTAGMAIINVEADRVFGYTAYGDKIDYFLVKLNHNHQGTTFKVGQVTHSMSDFMRI